jgi:hypothetical protein
MFTTHMTTLTQYDHKNNVEKKMCNFVMNVQMHIYVNKG